MRGEYWLRQARSEWAGDEELRAGRRRQGDDQISLVSDQVSTPQSLVKQRTPVIQYQVSDNIRLW